MNSNLPKKPSIAGLEKTLGHTFSDKNLILQALTHPSLEGRVNYQRLEFLGDRVLGIVIASLLFENYPGESEGQLSRRHAALVRKEALSQVAGTLKIETAIQMTPTMEKTGGRENPSVRSDALEALIGALFLDGGFKAARSFVEKSWQPLLDGKTSAKDPKSGLQEWAQGRGKPLPLYEVVERAGPDHAPSFSVKVSVDGLGSVTAKGTSKREAETKAAEKLLKRAK